MNQRLEKRIWKADNFLYNSENSPSFQSCQRGKTHGSLHNEKESPKSKYDSHEHKAVRTAEWTIKE